MAPGSLARVMALVAKDFRQFFRDPVLLILVLWLYTVEVVICAASLTFDLHDIPIGTLDRDRSPASVELIERFDRSPSFAVQYRAQDEDVVRTLLDRGKAQLIVVIPPGYGESADRGDPPAVQLLADGTNSVAARTALGDAERLLADEGFRRAAALQPAGLVPLAIDNRVRVWYNPDLRFAYFVVISMIALAAFLVGVIHPAATTVKEKESGTIELLLVSPLRSLEIIVGKAVPTLVIGLIALGPALLVARLFDVPFRGGVGTFLLLSAAFLLSATAVGLVIAALARTLQQALLVAFFVLFPVMFLSGTMTPIESMPAVLQAGSRLSPLRYYMEALLGVFLKGAGLDVLWPQLAWMLVLGLALFAGATALFRRRVA